MISKTLKNNNLRFSVSLVLLAALLASSVVMLRSDSLPFLIWWAACLITGIAVWPIASRLFAGFDDRGWLFSKVIGLALPGYIIWALTCFKITSFTTAGCVITVIAVGLLSWLFYYFRSRGSEHCLLNADIDLIVMEEVIFLAVFLMWTYFSGFRPEALSTEKFMDFGFMAAMMRDTNLPAIDMWYAGEPINYYYGGQYFAVFLTKLTSTDVDVTYNLMRALVGAYAFALPFSLAREAFRQRKDRRGTGELLPCIVGAMAGAAVSLAGNGHYVLYGLFGNILKPGGYEDYWFPSSTRFIGHNPETMDKTIHEFPSYSLVLGDLHAHMVNLIFVFTLLALIYAWFRKLRAMDEESDAVRGLPGAIKRSLADPAVWAMGFFLGMFQWTNYWDFIIYLTVVMISFVLILIRQCRSGTAEAAVGFVIRTALIAVILILIAYPFNMSFETMVSGVALCRNHSALYQLLILWGLPAASVIILLIFAVVRWIRIDLQTGDSRGFVESLTVSDMFMIMIGICAIGLIAIPELVYVRDIYENGFARSNTMFKLTYQAYIMFGISMIYGLFRILADAAGVISKAAAAVLVFIFVLTLGYFPYSVNCWFGNVLDMSEYRMLSATAYLINERPEDAEAVYWLNDNIEGHPVVLETNGDSYSTYCRVSAMTGLPTVLGWATHEWLWRNDLDAQYARSGDVDAIYTSSDLAYVRKLVEKYDIEYIFVGSCEREKYSNLNEGLLWNLGEVVFTGTAGENPAYIIKIS